MKVCLVADVMSPIAQGWAANLFGLGHDVHVITLRPDPGVEWRGATIHRLRAQGTPVVSSRNPLASLALAHFPALVNSLRNTIALSTRKALVARCRHVLAEIRPDVVHALRIPFEGIIAADSCGELPLILSVWGNDFTLHTQTGAMHRATRVAVERADVLIADCAVDIERAHTFGLRPGTPTFVLPGGGGVDLSRPPRTMSAEALPTIINARGIRGYSRTKEFLHAVALLRNRGRRFQVVFVNALGNREVARMLNRLGLESIVEVTGLLSQEEMDQRLSSSQIAVSPTIHDGTPNSLLEAMAAGCFPVCGDLPSIREWIVDGRNGRLCNPMSPSSIADAVEWALDHPNETKRAAEENLALVAARASRASVRAAVKSLYPDAYVGRHAHSERSEA